MNDSIPQNIEKWRYVSAGSDFIAVYQNEQRVHFVADLDENLSSSTDGPFIVRACQSYGPMLEALNNTKALLAACASQIPNGIKIRDKNRVTGEMLQITPLREAVDKCLEHARAAIAKAEEKV